MDATARPRYDRIVPPAGGAPTAQYYAAAANRLVTRRQETSTWLASCKLLRAQVAQASREANTALEQLARTPRDLSTIRGGDHRGTAATTSGASASTAGPPEWVPVYEQHLRHVADRLVHRRGLVASFTQVRLDPKRWLTRAMAANDVAMAQLHAAEAALEGVPAEALRLLDVAATTQTLGSGKDKGGSGGGGASRLLLRCCSASPRGQSATPRRRGDSVGPPTGGAVAVSRVAAAIRHVDPSVHPDVLRFDEFLQRHGGPNLGWRPEDHAAFLRVVTGMLDLQQLVDVVCARLPSAGGDAAARLSTAEAMAALCHEMPYAVVEKLRQVRLIGSSAVSSDGGQSAAVPSDLVDRENLEHLRRYLVFVELQRRRHLAIEAWRVQRLTDDENQRVVEQLRELKERDLEKVLEERKEMERRERTVRSKQQVEAWKQKQAEKKVQASLAAVQAMHEKAASRVVDLKLRAVGLHQQVDAYRQQRGRETATALVAAMSSSARGSRPASAASRRSVSAESVGRRSATPAETLSARWAQSLAITARRRSLIDSKDKAQQLSARQHRIDEAVKHQRRVLEQAMEKTAASATHHERGRFATDTEAMSLRRTASASGKSGDAALTRGPIVLAPRPAQAVPRTVRAMPAWKQKLMV